MKPIYVDFYDDVHNFVKLCNTLYAEGSRGPVFMAEGGGRGKTHFFLITPLYRAHLELLAKRAEDVTKEIEDKGNLAVVRASIMNWRSQNFMSPIKTDIPF